MGWAGSVLTLARLGCTCEHPRQAQACLGCLVVGVCVLHCWSLILLLVLWLGQCQSWQSQGAIAATLTPSANAFARPEAAL